MRFLGLAAGDEVSVFLVEVPDRGAQASRIEIVSEFALRVSETPAQGFDDANQGVGEFGRDVAVGDSGIEANQEEGEGGAGDGVVDEWFEKVVEKLLQEEAFTLLAGVVVAEAIAGGGARLAATAAVGIGELAELGALFGGKFGHRIFLES